MPASPCLLLHLLLSVHTYPAQHPLSCRIPIPPLVLCLPQRCTQSSLHSHPDTLLTSTTTLASVSVARHCR